MAGGLALLYSIDPELNSKVHGPLLSALGVVFVIQDAVFWLTHRKIDDLGKSAPLAKAEIMLSKLSALKRHGWNLLFVAMVFRVVLIVSGQLLQHLDLSGTVFHFGSSSVIESQLIGSLGYVALAIGIILSMKAYGIFRHVDEVTAHYELQSRQRTEAKTHAEKILESINSDWRNEPGLGQYPKTKFKNPH